MFVCQMFIHHCVRTEIFQELCQRFPWNFMQTFKVVFFSCSSSMRLTFWILSQITVIIESVQGKEQNWAFLTTLGNRFAGTSPQEEELRQESGELCSLYNRNPAKLADVWCLELCGETLFVLLLKFDAVLSIICGFLVTVSCWKHRLQCIVIVRSFLRLLKLRKLGVCNLDLSKGGLTLCHCVLDHGLNLHRNIPLIQLWKHIHDTWGLSGIQKYISGYDLISQWHSLE